MTTSRDGDRPNALKVASSNATPSRTLYRAMRRSSDGMPEPGESARTLGVRVPQDVEPDRNGLVSPDQGGLSVTPDDMLKLPRFARPRELGGLGKDPVWAIREQVLGPNIRYRPDPDHPDEHGFVEPAGTMHINDFRRAIANTQGLWTETRR